MRANELSKQLAEELAQVSNCAAFEARCLLEHYCSLTLTDIYLGKELGETDLSAIEAAVAKRKQHYPLQYILGKWEFMGNEFLLNEEVLIPRPETELLCECLADKINADSVIYDICAGTGCIGISLSLLTGASVYAFEKYEKAFAALEANISNLHAEKVNAIQWDITRKPDFSIPQANFLISNPPYIESAVLPSLQPEVLEEPHTALDGGEDGLVFYRAIACNFTALLRKGGYAAFEFGEGQAKAVKEIFSSLRFIEMIKDYNGIERVVLFRKDF